MLSQENLGKKLKIFVYMWSTTVLDFLQENEGNHPILKHTSKPYQHKTVK